ncbi:MAG: zinc-ribbon domain-containing protein [Lachnospiraceae bacterium]|nr:zinc-ribbon domain-containing protein [Lachnospiraceae bacterium]
MVCQKCGANLEDGAKFCDKCGASVAAGAAPQGAAAPQPAVPQAAPQPQPSFDPYDHSAEFNAKDISDNKVIALCPYVFSILGILVALLMSKESPYVAFHVRQALKIYVCMGISVFVNVIPLLGQVAYGIISILLAIAIIVAFFDVCNGKAKEAMFVKGLGFLK